MRGRSDGITPSPLFLRPLPPASCKLPLKFTKERDIKRSRFPRKGRGENSEVKKKRKKKIIATEGPTDRLGSWWYPAGGEGGKEGAKRALKNWKAKAVGEEV